LVVSDTATASPAAAPVPYFQPLDIVRFVAATLILVTHSYDHWLEVPAIRTLTGLADNQPAWWAVKLRDIVGSFNIGVDIFFLMSGFLITYLLLAEQQRYGRIAIGSFYMRRVLRIWPLYYFCVAMAPVLSHFANEPAANMPFHLLFIGNFDLMERGWGSTAVNHLWSICIEEHFYLIWPLVVTFVPRPKLTTVFCAIIALSFFTRLYYHFFVVDPWMKLYLNTLCRWDTLAIGSLLAYLYYQRLIAPQVPRAIRFMIYGSALFLFANDAYGNWDNIFLLSIKKYFYIGVVAFFIGNVLFNPDSLVRWRERTIFNYFGKISYGIYMYHGFVIFAIVRVFPYFHTPLFMLWVLIFTLIISALSYELVEKPILKFKKHFDAFRAKRAMAAEQVPVSS
jgi:peptidoglycan/LPS O-acetylase OafA/YrhL